MLVFSERGDEEAEQGVGSVVVLPALMCRGVSSQELEGGHVSGITTNPNRCWDWSSWSPYLLLNSAPELSLSFCGYLETSLHYPKARQK